MLKPVVFSSDRWTVGQLTELRELHASFRGDLTETAAAVGRPIAECDVALFALLGRSVMEAHAALNRTVRCAA